MTLWLVFLHWCHPPNVIHVKQETRYTQKLNERHEQRNPYTTQTAKSNELGLQSHWESVHVYPNHCRCVSLLECESEFSCVCVLERTNGWYSIHEPQPDVYAMVAMYWSQNVVFIRHTHTVRCIRSGNDLILLWIFNMRIPVQCAKALLTRKLFQRVTRIIRPWMSSSFFERYDFVFRRERENEPERERVECERESEGTRWEREHTRAIAMDGEREREREWVCLCKRARLFGIFRVSSRTTYMLVIEPIPSSLPLLFMEWIREQLNHLSLSSGHCMCEFHRHCGTQADFIKREQENLREEKKRFRRESVRVYVCVGWCVSTKSVKVEREREKEPERAILDCRFFCYQSRLMALVKLLWSWLNHFTYIEYSISRFAWFW